MPILKRVPTVALLAGSVVLAQPAYAQDQSASSPVAPFYGNPVFVTWGFPFIYSPPYPGPLDAAGLGVGVPPSARTTNNLPVLGLNTVAHTAGGDPVRYVRTRAAIVAALPLSGGPEAASAVAASPERTGPAAGAGGQGTLPLDGERGLAGTSVRFQQVMRAQAMIAGRLERLGATGALVRVQRGGGSVALRYALTDVYFFRGADLLDAASAPDRLSEGDELIVPERSGDPGPERPRVARP